MPTLNIGDIFPVHIFDKSGANAEFASKKSNHDVTQDIFKINIDDRSDHACHQFQNYIWQATTLMSYNPELSKARLAEAARWAAERFEYDKSVNRQWRESEHNFFYEIMNLFIRSSDAHGVQFFFEMLNSTGLIDVVSVSNGYICDWVAISAINRRITFAIHLLVNGFKPRKVSDHWFYENDSAFVNDSNTTAVCYFYDGYIAATLERLGYPANRVSSNRTVGWFTDISLYQGEEFAKLRSHYMGVVFKELNELSESSETGLFRQLEDSKLFNSLSFLDTHSAVKLERIAATSIGCVLSEVFELIQAGNEPDFSSDHLNWLNGSPENPFIRVNETKSHRKMVLESNNGLYKDILTWLVARGAGDSLFTLNQSTGEVVSLNSAGLLEFSPPFSGLDPEMLMLPISTEAD